MTKSLGSAALLLTALVGCGGGANGSAPAAAPGSPAVGLEAEAAGKPAAPKAGAPATPAAPKIDPSLIPEPGAPLVRETYTYVGGSRDPFASVLEGTTVGPELADLDVVAIYLLRNQSASVAVLRDRVSSKRYTVVEGERVGRARVSSIKAKDVIFTIDDYGTQRQVTLSIRKREDITP